MLNMNFSVYGMRKILKSNELQIRQAKKTF